MTQPFVQIYFFARVPNPPPPPPAAERYLFSKLARHRGISLPLTNHPVAAPASICRFCWTVSGTISQVKTSSEVSCSPTQYIIVFIILQFLVVAFDTETLNLLPGLEVTRGRRLTFGTVYRLSVPSNSTHSILFRIPSIIVSLHVYSCKSICIRTRTY